MFFGDAAFIMYFASSRIAFPGRCTYWTFTNGESPARNMYVARSFSMFGRRP